MVMKKCSIFVLLFVIIFNLQAGLSTQPKKRPWRVAFMPNVRYAFPTAITWLNEFKHHNFNISVIDVPDTMSGPSNKLTAQIWVTLEGEYNPEHWEPLPISHEKIQIHFWPMTRGYVTGFKEIKHIAGDNALILCSDNDILSRTCFTIFETTEEIYQLNPPKRVRRQDFANWPPYNEFQDGDELNTIILPLVNYNPNEMMIKVIRTAKRRSIIIPDESRVDLFDALDTLKNVGSSWPRNRIANCFFPGVIPKYYLGLYQRQLFPVQTTADIMLLVSTQPGPNHLDKNDRRLLFSDLRTIYAQLEQEVEQAIDQETKSWHDVADMSLAAVDSTRDRVWRIAQKARWALILCLDQSQNDRFRKRLSDFIRLFVDTFRKNAADKFVYAKRVRFRELDYLIYPNNFWAINNLVDIYNKVGNYAGAKILVETILDEDINLEVTIPHDPNKKVTDRDRQRDENFADFLDNYALALEGLRVAPIFPRLVRRFARDRRAKWRSD